MNDFSTLIIDWYSLNKRDLPWRRTKKAYFVWISEIILQQTQVVQGLDYYYRFINQFKTVEELANANQTEVLKLWQGLGYYSRARNMHFAAQQVMNEFKGVFPTSYQNLLKLKGVGEYTAAAVSSIVSNLPHAVVDGNVYRVLSRCFIINTPVNTLTGKKEFTALANDLLNPSLPGDHNQALMEIGALVCKPKNPNCENCPLQSKCLAFANKTMLSYPVKEKKLKIKTRYLNYFVEFNTHQIIIKQRQKGDVWQGLYDFPLNESESEITLIKGYNLDLKLKHILTHQKIFASFWIKKTNNLKVKSDEIIINLNQLKDFPKPQLIVKYLKQSNFFNNLNLH